MVYDELRNSCGGAKKGGTKPLSRGRERRLASLVQKLEKNRSIDDYNAVIQEQWDKLGDFLIVIVPTEKAEKTKRGILAKIARIYDPLGVASLLTLCGKLLYRDACSQVGQMGIKITGKNYIHEGSGSVSGTNQQHILTYLWRCK